MSAEVQPVWTGLGALLSAGAGLFLLQVCGEALFHGSFLPLRLFLVGFARVCSSHNDAERCEASRGLELELIHCRHWPSAKSRDKERYCTYSEPMERCKCREGGELESTQSTAQRVKSRLYCLDFKVFHCLVSLQPSNPSLSLWAIHLGHMSSWTLGIL